MQVIERSMSEGMGTDFNPAHPSQGDPLEVRIVGLMQKEFLVTPWAKDAFSRAKKITIDYLGNSIAILNDPSRVHDETQKVLKDLSTNFQSRIVLGEKNLQQLHERQPGFIVANHLGVYKLTGIKPQELGLNLPVEIVHPFVMFYQSLVPVAQQLGCNLYEAAYPYKTPIKEIQEAAGSILVPSGKGSFSSVVRASERAIGDHPNGLFTIFPEGGTSGKRNGGGPYDLEEFHAGSFAIAAKVGIPVIPVAQYFNPNRGFELRVFNPMTLERNKPKEYYEKIANDTRSEMQTWLNERQA